MPRFSKKSLEKLATVHPELQRLFNAVIKKIDIIILCGYRGEKEQNEAVENGNSDLLYPHSLHNKKPSLAVDSAPYPLVWEDIEGFKEMNKTINQTAKELGIKAKSGIVLKSGRVDYPHTELLRK